jgi:hypothetical protein
VLVGKRVDSMEAVLAWLWDAFLATLLHLMQATLMTFLELFILFGPLLLATLSSHLISLRIERRLVGLVGVRGYIVALGWIGTPIHELGHAIMAKLFGHRIESMKLFSPDVEKGQLGYVQHSYNQDNIFHVVGNFFIALGPILLGAGVLVLTAWLLLGEGVFHFPHAAASELTDFSQMPGLIIVWLGNVGEALVSTIRGLSFDRWQTWLFLYLLVAVGSHVNLSPADLSTAKGGFNVLLTVLFFANVVMLLFADVPLQVFWWPGRYLGLLSSIVMVCAGAMLPLWGLLEAIAAIQERPAPGKRKRSR